MHMTKYRYVTVVTNTAGPKDGLGQHTIVRCAYVLPVPAEIPFGTENTQPLLDHVFRQTNKVDGTEELTKTELKATSSSVGDLFIVDEQYFLIEPLGFKEITAKQAVLWQGLGHRDTSMGWNWCVSKKLIE